MLNLPGTAAQLIHDIVLAALYMLGASTLLFCAIVGVLTALRALGLPRRERVAK